MDRLHIFGAFTCFFHKKKVYKTRGSIGQNLKRILRKLQGSVPKLSVFVGQNSMLRHYSIINIKDRIQIRVYWIKKEEVTHFSQFTLVKAKKIVRKFQARFLEKLRELRLR